MHHPNKLMERKCLFTVEARRIACEACASSSLQSLREALEGGEHEIPKLDSSTREAEQCFHMQVYHTLDRPFLVYESLCVPPRDLEISVLGLFQHKRN